MYNKKKAKAVRIFFVKQHSMAMMQHCNFVAFREEKTTFITIL
jgi:hypothetical protein